MRMRMSISRLAAADEYGFHFHCSDCGHYQISSVSTRLFLYGEAVVPVQPCQCVSDSRFGPGYRVRDLPDAQRGRQPDPPAAATIRAAMERPVPVEAPKPAPTETPADDRPDPTIRFSLLELT